MKEMLVKIVLGLALGIGFLNVIMAYALLFIK